MPTMIESPLEQLSAEQVERNGTRERLAATRWLLGVGGGTVIVDTEGEGEHVTNVGLGIIAVRTPLKTSMANSIAGPIVRTSRTECLDHLVINERHPYVVGG